MQKDTVIRETNADAYCDKEGRTIQSQDHLCVTVCMCVLFILTGTVYALMYCKQA